MWRLLFPRKEVAGKRFFATKCNQRENNVGQDLFCRGVIRAASHVDFKSSSNVKLLVEFDDKDWSCRQWIIITQFDLFLIEDVIVNAPSKTNSEEYQPALSFTTVVDEISFSITGKCLVEYFSLDRNFQLIDKSKIKLLKEEEIMQIATDVKRLSWPNLLKWIHFQISQQILVNNPLSAVKSGVRVYNMQLVDDEQQWFHATIQNADMSTKIMIVADAKGKLYNLNPSLLQMEIDNRDITKILSLSGNEAKVKARINEKLRVKRSKLDICDASELPEISASQSLVSNVKSSIVFSHSNSSILECERNLFEPSSQNRIVSTSATLANGSSYQMSSDESSAMDAMSCSNTSPVLAKPISANHNEVKLKNLRDYRQKFKSTTRFPTSTRQTVDHNDQRHESVRVKENEIDGQRNRLNSQLGFAFYKSSSVLGNVIPRVVERLEKEVENETVENVIQSSAKNRGVENHMQSEVRSREVQCQLMQNVNERSQGLGQNQICSQAVLDQTQSEGIQSHRVQDWINEIQSHIMTQKVQNRARIQQWQGVVKHEELNSAVPEQIIEGPATNKSNCTIRYINNEKTTNPKEIQQLLNGSECQEVHSQIEQVKTLTDQNKNLFKRKDETHHPKSHQIITDNSSLKLFPNSSTLNETRVSSEQVALDARLVHMSVASRNEESSLNSPDMKYDEKVNISAARKRTTKDVRNQSGMKIKNIVCQSLTGPSVTTEVNVRKKSDSSERTMICFKKERKRMINSSESGKWCQEIEEELKDISCILGMMKQLEGIVMIKRSSADDQNKHLKELPPQSLVKTDDDDHQKKLQLLQKSDCEAKIACLKTELTALGLEFANPSTALTEKKLNLKVEQKLFKSTFIQDDSCLTLPDHMTKCLECKSTRSEKMAQGVLCRFHAFRRLTQSKKGGLICQGFSIPTDADAVDISLWMPLPKTVDPQLNVETAKYIIKNVGVRFCELVEQEKEAITWVPGDTDIAWKRAVSGIREMCDVCNTTLFNMHWVCRKCGYVVCLDCYRTLTRRCTRCRDNVNCIACGRGKFKWDKCSISHQLHEPKEMILTQIIPSDALWVVGRMIHDIRKKWKITVNCACRKDQSFYLSDVTVIRSDQTEHGESPCLTNNVERASRVSIINSNSADAIHCSLLSSAMDDEQSLRSNLTNSIPAKLKDFVSEESKNCEIETNKLRVGENRFNDILRRVKNNGSPKDHSEKASVEQSKENVPPHKWLDCGRLLQLIEPRNQDNLNLFQQQWQKGCPVMVSNCDRYICKEIWTPDAFCSEFGDRENDLVDCRHKVILIGHRMRKFWKGFERVGVRLKDDDGQPMILKLKDWPPMDDFSEVLPQHFSDLLQALPLPEYTQRSGVLNLASRLPEFFVRPDLGPKMYNAYGSALHPLVGSTNLHLDVSDAVNLILYVGIAKDDTEDHEKAAMEAMIQAGCCKQTLERVTKESLKPGALWHIFDAKDSDKIRQLLTKVGEEIGEPVDSHHDPIHDQSWYLDEKLRERLLREYSVQGYTLIQCIGDAVFIPAGAPHQVRNLHSCIKAAEDFVSPENLSHCFRMTQEFRYLSDTHSNHEDKLQVKNIIYHAVKDAIAVLGQNETDQQ